MNTINQKAKASQILVTIAAFVIVVAGMSAAKVILVPFLLAAFIAIISARHCSGCSVGVCPHGLPS
jgi:predicted PurR-regulated permease PerM